MRNIINISLPKELSKVVDEAVKSGQFATKSEFFRNLLRYWKEEQQLIKDIAESEKDFKEGRFKLLKSLKDLR